VDAKGHLVLIVEDNEKNLKLARDLLGVTGFRTLAAGTAEEGLVLARQHRPDLVLMDVRLPGMSGVEALAALRADPATAGLKVVAFTASVTSVERAQMAAAGFDGFLAKPISVREFPAQVRRYCQRGGA
jgi:two-component system, cell cycle response regulator DivK